MHSFLIRLNKVIVYVKIALVVGLLITGYRMIGHFNFINRGLADSLHRVYLNVPFIVLFILHTLISVRISLMRKRQNSLFLDILFLVVGVAFAVYFSYFALSLYISFGR
jgi:hypothetical protein